MIGAKINLSKIDKNRIYVGKDGDKYIDIIIIPKQTSYSDHMIVQSITKEERDAGKQGPILGNGKNIGRNTSPSGDFRSSAPPSTRDDMPF